MGHVLSQRSAAAAVSAAVMAGLAVLLVPASATASVGWQDTASEQLDRLAGPARQPAPGHDYEFAPMRGTVLPERCPAPRVTPVSGWSATHHIRLRLQCDASSGEGFHLLARKVALGSDRPVESGVSPARAAGTSSLAVAATAPRTRVFGAGSPVQLVIERPGFSLMAEGRAQGHGFVGESVAVLLPGGRRVSGIVAATGVVEIPLKSSPIQP